MPDIWMCAGVPEMALCQQCHRKNATPGFQQSYFLEPPIQYGLCGYYWPEKEKEEGE
jgi:hypothetical protein